jgi:hypothetical protein
MHPSAHFLTRIPPAQARQAAQMLITEQMGIKAPTSTIAFEDLKALPEDARRLSSLTEALHPDKRSSPSPWYARSGLIDLLNPAVQVVAREFPLPIHRPFCRVLQARSYLSQQYLIGLEGLTVDPVTEGGEFLETRESVTVDGQTITGDIGSFEHIAAEVKRYGRLLTLRVETVANDDAGYFGQATQALTAAAYRKEAKAVFGLLENGATLEDGAAWFDDSNSVTESTLLGALDAAIEKMAAQTFISGEFVDAAPAYLIVPAAWRTLSDRTFANLIDQGIKIVTSNQVSHGYLMADPAVAPALGLIGFGDLTPQVDINPKPSARYGLQMRVEHSFAVAPLSRRGIVKLTVA